MSSCTEGGRSGECGRGNGWQSPGLLDAYLIVAGIVAGLVLGPAVLGQAAPGAYERWFIGGASERLQLAAAEGEMARAEAAVGMTNSPSASADLKHRTGVQRALLTAKWEAAKQEQLTALRGRVLTLLLATAVLMVIESLVAPEHAAFRSRLSLARYALVALGVALMLAQPAAVEGVSAVFLGLVVLLAVALVATPLGRCGKGEEQGSAQG